MRHERPPYGHDQAAMGRWIPTNKQQAHSNGEVDAENHLVADRDIASAPVEQSACQRIEAGHNPEADEGKIDLPNALSHRSLPVAGPEAYYHETAGIATVRHAAWRLALERQSTLAYASLFLVHAAECSSKSAC